MKSSLLILVLSFLFHSVKAQNLKELPSLSASIHSHRSSGAFTYTLSTLNEPYEELTGATSVNNGEVWDDPQYMITLPFPFELNGNDIQFFQLSGGGAVLTAPTNDPEVFTLLYLFETDLIDRGFQGGPSLSPISVKTEGEAGSRILKLEFKNAGSNYELATLGTLNMFINFQLWLYEGSNAIEFRFGPHSIEDPDTFYNGLSGAYIGLTDYFEIEDLLINPHFIVGDVASPNLSTVLFPITGTPTNGTVYRLTIDLPLEIQVSGTNATSFCNPNGTATVEVTGGAGLYTFSWSNNETTQTITGLDAGTYSVTVTDSNGSTASDSVVITNVVSMSINVQSTNETAVGANDGTALVSPTGGLEPYTYLWSSGQTTSLITNLAPGTYTVTVTDAAGCTQVEMATVNAFGCPELIIEEAIFHMSCFGICDGTIEIHNVPGGVHPLIYLWENGDTNEARDFLCAGTYTVTITDASGCIVSETFQIIQPAALQVNATSTDETATDANDGTAWAAPLGGTGPFTYEWNTGSTDSLISALVPGIYTVTVTDARGCIDSQAVVVNEFLCIEITDVSVTNANCFGVCDGAISVTVSGAGPYGYQWSTGQTTPTITDLCAGTYNVVIIDVNQNCSSDVISFEITQSDVLNATIDEIVHFTDTTISSVEISVSGGTPPYTFTWTGLNGFVAISEDLSNVPADIYSLVITDANGCVFIQNGIEIRDETVGIGNIYPLQVHIYPNPAMDDIFIDIASYDGLEIELLTLDGRVLQAWSGMNKINVQGVSSGMYLLKLVSGERFSVQRVVVN